MSLARAILALSRPFYLPTIWSNSLAGWWLAGGGHTERVPYVLLAGTFLALGGLFLNDAFDADYDQQHHPTKPIACGSISRSTVWRLGLSFLAAGALLLLLLGPLTGGLGLVLVFLLVLFNALHRFLPGAPLVLGLCRLLLYLLGGSIASQGINGSTIWCGLAIAIYTTGTACFRYWEEKPSAAKNWVVLLLLTPIFLAMIMNAHAYRQSALLLSLVLALWIIRSLRLSLWSNRKYFAATAHALTAGIVFADWLAVAHAPRDLSFIFIALFLAVLALQLLTIPRKAL